MRKPRRVLHGAWNSDDLCRAWSELQAAAGKRRQLTTQECGAILRKVVPGRDPHNDLERMVELGLLIPQRSALHRRCTHYYLATMF